MPQSARERDRPPHRGGAARLAIAGVWANTSAQITSVTLNGGADGALLAGTEMAIWGKDDN